MILFDNSKYSRLRHKFPGAEKIAKNFSQSYQDMFALTMTNGKRGGTYVEIGAMDGQFISNTYLLEKEFDWKGISVDIDEATKKSFKKTKRKNTVIIQDALAIDYPAAFAKAGFGTQIDYLQLDIEPQAQTFECLKKLPMDKYRFSVITYETDYYDPSVSREESLKNRDASRMFLQDLGYELVVGNVCNTSTEDPFEDWYIDPKVVDPKIVAALKGLPEYNNTAESFMLGA